MVKGHRMVHNREQAARAAEQSTVNVPDTCQLWTRDKFEVPSVGDFDGDGAADAEDGWKSEPVNRRHPGDRHPPRGVPVSYGGGSHDNGHRAVSIGGGEIRTTDGNGLGHVATRDIGWPEREWGLTYLGWSETCDGVLIPLPAEPPKTLVSLFLEGGPRYELKLLDRAVVGGRTGTVKEVRDEIVHQVTRLHRVDGRRIRWFLAAFHSDRSLRIGLLSEAIKAGRTGTVKDVRGKIMKQIHRLPSH